MISAYSKPLRVFEHDFLRIDENVFKRSYWNALGKYNDDHDGTFFSLTPNGVKFKHYVGVIQVGNLTIEILPKVSKIAIESEKEKWQKVLIDMLRDCHWMKVYANEKAALRFKPNSILEAYLELFIQECEKIIREGLVKKYRTISENCTALKGKLIFAKHIHQNLVHQERFYTNHSLFDRDNIYNRILLKALKLIPALTQSPFLKDRVESLLLEFPELEDVSVTHQTFESLIYDRKTTRYKEAMEIAAMLLLNYRPDISHGHNNILALLFNMNDLWQEYIFHQLSVHKPFGWSVFPQNSKSFWQPAGSNRSKTIRPDILLQQKKENETLNIILDAKWKLPLGNIPDDVDLKQMFVYNEYWQSKEAFLVYPKSSYSEQPKCYQGAFKAKTKNTPEHNCGIMKISVLNSKNIDLDKTVGARIFKYLCDDSRKELKDK